MSHIKIAAACAAALAGSGSRYAFRNSDGQRFAGPRFFHGPENGGNGGGGRGTDLLEPKAFQQKVLDGVEQLRHGQKNAEEKLGDLDEAFKLIKEENEHLKKASEDVAKKLLEFEQKRLHMLTRTPNRTGEVSEDSARYLGALLALDGLTGNKFHDQRQRDIAEGLFKAITGISAKSALSSADIPLPVGYSGDIVELVYQFGQARQYGTVMPLPNGSFKLPKLSTDPTFTLNAMSASIAEKSPQAAFVNFNAEKFGGIIRLPSELDDDSIIGLGQFLARYAARNMARSEDWNFFRGTGAATGVNGTAKGLTSSCVDDGIVVNQASTKTKQSDMTLQNLRDLRSASGINGAVLENAKYYFHPTYEAALVAFNTSSTVVPFQRNGKNATLDGYPIVWCNVMPAYSTTAAVSLAHVLFGDVSFNYLGVRGAMRFDTSKEAGFTTDEILVRALERFTIGKMAADAVAALVTAAS